MVMVSYLLSKKDTQPLVAPLGLSGRIKYTCVALSPGFIALGANTGGVYLFHRDLRYIQLLANKEGAVSVVKISPDEQFLAVVAGGGWLVLWELRLSGDGVCKRLQVSGLLKEAVIKDVAWEERRGRFYFGDSLGRVAVASLPKSAKKSSLLRRSNEIVFQDKSAIVQLDLHGDVLLVSTSSRVVMLQLSSASRTAVQVGKKTREGEFGACLDVREKDGQLLVYSARPGGRLWEAGLEGDVQSTIKMRELCTTPPSPILGHGFEPHFSTASELPPPPLSLPCLLSLHNGQHLLSWDDVGLYLWQPVSWKLAVWTKDLCGLVGVACVGEGEGGVSFCAIVGGGRKVVIVTMATLLHCIQWLLEQQLLNQVTKLVWANMAETVSLLSLHPSLHTDLLTISNYNLTTSAQPSLQLLALNSLLYHMRKTEANLLQREGGVEEEVGGAKSRAVSRTEAVSHDDSELCGRPARVHRRSNSWSGEGQEMVAELEGKEYDEEVWSLSDSHTPSLSQETSLDPVSMETLSLESSAEHPGVAPPTGGSPPQQLSLPSSLDDSSKWEGVEPENKPRPLRSQSLQLADPPRIAMATLPDRDSDDVIAVPVRGSAASSEGGGKQRSKRKPRRGKKSSSSSLPPPSHSPPDAKELSLGHIPEEDLPFPSARLPDGGHHLEYSDSAHIQRGSSFMTKMRELAKQGGQNMGLEPEALQEALQQPVKKVRELLSSLTVPVPTALSIPEPQTVFINEDCIISRELPRPLAGGDAGSHDLAPPETELPSTEFAAATEATKIALVQPDVYCSAMALRDTMNRWVVAMETALGSGESVSLNPNHLGVDEGSLVDLLTLSLEMEAYGSEGGFIPFLRHYSQFLRGMRTMRMLGVQKWGVRREGWRVLVERGSQERADMKTVVKDVTSQSALAADLPTFLSSLVTSDPKALVRVCVESWPKVQPWEVALACTSGQSEGERAGDLPLYVDYLHQLLASAPRGRAGVGDDEECVLATIEWVLLAGPPLDHLKTEGGRPRPWSHKVSWPHSALLEQLVDLCVSMTTPNLTQASSLCEEYGYWLGVVQLAVAGGNKSKSLLIALSLRDASLLDASRKWGNLLETVSEWQETLQVMCSLTATKSEDRETGQLTIGGLVRLLVASVGPSLATKVIDSVGVVGGGALGEEGVEVHSLLVELAGIHAEQRAVSRSLLEKVDRYLWSRRPSAVSAELEMVEEREREGKREQVLSGLEWRPVLEESSRHWGVRVSGREQCGVCCFPISLKVSVQHPGLLIFGCGHAYHRQCLPEQACFLCFKQNFSEHLTIKTSRHS